MIFETPLPASCPPSCPAKELPASQDPPQSPSALWCWVPQLWQDLGCHCCPQGHPILGTVLASLSHWPTAVPGGHCASVPMPRNRAGVFLPLGTSRCQPPAQGCQGSPPQGTAQGPAIALLRPQGSHGCGPAAPHPSEGAVPRVRRGTRSLQQWHLGYFPWGPAPAYLLETGVLCPVDCPALPQCADPAVILFQRSPAGTGALLNTSHHPGLCHDHHSFRTIPESHLAWAHRDTAAEKEAPVGWAGWCQGAGQSRWAGQGRAGTKASQVPWLVVWGCCVARAVTLRTVLSGVGETRSHPWLGGWEAACGHPGSPHGWHDPGPTAATHGLLGCLSAVGLSLLPSASAAFPAPRCPTPCPSDPLWPGSCMPMLAQVPTRSHCLPIIYLLTWH